jgi:hypothetical protein
MTTRLYIFLFTIGFYLNLFGQQPMLPEEPNFTPHRGFYDSVFDCTVRWDSTGSVIRYTLDGSDPQTSSTAVERVSPAQIHIDPSSTQGRAKTPAVVLRAYALINGAPVTQVGTHTYIFITKVLTQVYPGGKWPASNINGQIFDWNMDQNVVNDPRYKNQVDDALLDIPSYSIVTELDNLFDPQIGIYVNAMNHGRDWERPASVELIDPQGKEKGFQINCGLRIRGGWSRHPDNPKHAFRLFFRTDYGKGKLDYPLFGDEGANSFDCLDLRTGQNYSWSYKGSPACIMIRDVFSRDCQRDMGQPYTRSRACHLYLNGMYWGLFQTQERPEADYAETYFGGDEDDYDVVKVDIENNYIMEATDGTLDAYNALWDIARRGFANNTAYFKIQGKLANGTDNWSYPVLVNLNNLIDYLLIIYYTGNFDSPVTAFRGNRVPNNFYGIYNRFGRSGFIFFAHDAEHTLMDPRYSENFDYGLDRTGPYPGGDLMQHFNPQWLHQKLSDHAEYRMRFADRVYRHFFNRGALTRDASRLRLAARRDEIAMAIIAESARWGDARAYPARTKDDHWLPSVNWVTYTFFANRTEVVLEQLKLKNLYPAIDPPLFYSGSQTISDSIWTISPGSQIRLVNPNANAVGSILYTLDGSDPRAFEGGIAAAAQDGGDAQDITILSNGVLKARVKDGTTWSALHEILLNTGQDLSALKITEIHYNPLADGLIAGSEFEFIELKNTSTTALPVSGIQFVEGIGYQFPNSAVIDPGGFVVLASNASFFKQRYGFAPFSEYNRQLENAGERVTLVSMAGDTLWSVRYNDKSPWPEQADGSGYSLVARHLNGNGNPDQPDYWTVSGNVHGSPGADDIASGIEPTRVAPPRSFALEQNYPNPFNLTTQIRYALEKEVKVTIMVYNMLGQFITTLVNQKQLAGTYSIQWEGRDFQGNLVSSGIYFYQMKAGSFTETRKMILVK